MSEIAVRLRHSKGTSTLKIPSNLSFADLQKRIQEVTKVEASRQKLKMGYPPQEISGSGAIDSMGIQTGETLVLEELPQKLMNEVTQQSQSVDGKKVLRRVVPADNSCLFNSIAYAMEAREKDLGSSLRHIIAAFVESDPITYSTLFLEKTPEAYQNWILQDTSWGGAIELSILSKYYCIQIAAISIQNLRVDIYGEADGFDNRIYVIYDGIHYDVLAKNTSENSPETSDVTIFGQNDEEVMQGALAVADELRRKKQFTDTSKFALVCGTCYQGLVGQKEAVEHCRQTGHTNFQESH